jgi:hypothetical protein
MSRGLGKIERLILAELDGGGNAVKGRYSYGWYTTTGGVYHLRTLSKALARQHGGMDRRYTSSTWQAAFSRAVHSLIRKQLIKAVTLVPLYIWDGEYPDKMPCEVMELSDG